MDFTTDTPVRVYSYHKGERSKWFRCDTFLPGDLVTFNEDGSFPDIRLEFRVLDLHYEFSLSPRIRVSADPKISSSEVIVELERFIQTIKQMYSL